MITDTRRQRRGNYAMLLSIALVVLLGFGALAIDGSYRLLARAEAQDVADAAGQAGMVVLRQTGDADAARDAAAFIVAANEVAGEAPAMTRFQVGTWDDDPVNPGFTPSVVRPNAVRVGVSRTGDQAIPFTLARIWGYTDFGVAAASTSAVRSTQVVLVLDITGSWGESAFNNARRAVLGAIDLLSVSAAGTDQVGMTIFTNRYAWEYTPFSNLANPGIAATVRSSWSLLNIASKAGTDGDPRDGLACALNGAPLENDFTSPPGGCYPEMPREYRDEPGTDHSTGMRLAQQMYDEAAGTAAYRAMIVITDGRPNGLGGASGTQRAADGYVEDRWREYVGPVPRTTQDIRDEAIVTAQEMWDEQRVHTWVVSLVQNDPMMPAMVQGDGYFTLTNDSAELAGILAQIISELPLAIVE